jgi:hypothetical protein
VKEAMGNHAFAIHGRGYGIWGGSDRGQPRQDFHCIRDRFRQGADVKAATFVARCGADCAGFARNVLCRDQAADAI